MNIGIDARMYGPSVGGGGLGRYVEQLVTELQAIDHKNHYVLFLKKENFDACIITNSNFEKRLADVHWYTLEEQMKMGKIVDHEHLDLVHFPHWNVPLFLRTPFVVTIHDLILLDEPFSSKISTRHQTIFTLKYWAYKMVLSHAITAAKKVITVSHATENSILKHIEGVDPKNIEVVYEGVTPLAQNPSQPPLGRGGENAFTPPAKEGPGEVSGSYLLYVGNAYPHKNLEKLLEAFKHIRTSRPDLKLILAGRESVFYTKLLKHIPVNVEFVKNPTDTELADLYQNALAYVYPSRIEGFGLPPLEAMSAHIPTAVSNIPSLTEILGDAAMYFNQNDAQSIANTVLHLINEKDVREQLVLKGLERIKRYSWQKMATTIQTLYETCGKKGS